MDADALLRRGAAELAPHLDEQQLLALHRYVALLQRWNSTYNLTAVRDPDAMLTRHLLDSLAVAPHLDEQRILDVGSGAGLPGVVLAIACPRREFHLLDSNGKKTRFLFQVKTALRLDNMNVHQARVEAFRPELPFDAVLSRAYAALRDMVAGCRHLLAEDGRFLAMKGTYPAGELADLPGDCRVTGVTPLDVPGLDEQRHLIEIRLRPQQQDTTGDG